MKVFDRLLLRIITYLNYKYIAVLLIWIWYLFLMSKIKLGGGQLPPSRAPYTTLYNTNSRKALINVLRGTVYTRTSHFSVLHWLAQASEEEDWGPHHNRDVLAKETRQYHQTVSTAAASSSKQDIKRIREKMSTALVCHSGA